MRLAEGARFLRVPGLKEKIKDRDALKPGRKRLVPPF